ncbi:transposase [Evansella halocellulosilytica]|uniref:transposase n=1 Tax=Evansella halocellulosilytica TaxID=2011013 RepID=UPI00211CFF16|nr:transposase [Evansella halocellulosilytica]
MARKKRIWVPGQFVHIVSRGVQRVPLFVDENDHIEAFYILSDVYKKAPFEMVSYCFMTNHYHFLLRSFEHSITKIMSYFNKRFADYFNNKYCYSGCVFESRFFSSPVNDELGILEVSKYIHNNPVRAGIVNYPGGYRWSSFDYYLFPYAVPPVFFNNQYILNIFPGTEDEKRGQYQEWCLGSDDVIKNVGQSTIRSQR